MIPFMGKSVDVYNFKGKAMLSARSVLLPMKESCFDLLPGYFFENGYDFFFYDAMISGKDYIWIVNRGESWINPFAKQFLS